MAEEQEQQDKHKEQQESQEHQEPNVPQEVIDPSLDDYAVKMEEPTKKSKISSNN